MIYALDLRSHSCIIVTTISPSHRKGYITKGDVQSVTSMPEGCHDGSS